MTKSPLVCICIPTYNAESTIRETIESLLSQTYSNLVIRISDNASTDGTVEIIKSIDDSRVFLHKNENNIGAEENFNRCIEIASGKYTAIFHADDIYEPNIVETQVRFLEQHIQAGAVFSEASIINENGNRIGAIEYPDKLGSLEKIYNFETIFKAILKNSNFLICPSAMVRTEVYQYEIKKWNSELFNSSADLDVWLRILNNHSIGLIPLKLMRYRISSNHGSAKVRMSTKPADFFLVIDNYIEKKEILKLIGNEDLENYTRLERRDRVMRAVNCLIKDQVENAKLLLQDIPSFSAFNAALKNKKGMFVFIGGIYIKIILHLGLKNFGKKTLSLFKKIMRK